MVKKWRVVVEKTEHVNYVVEADDAEGAKAAFEEGGGELEEVDSALADMDAWDNLQDGHVVEVEEIEEAK